MGLSSAWISIWDNTVRLLPAWHAWVPGMHGATLAKVTVHCTRHHKETSCKLWLRCVASPMETGHGFSVYVWIHV